MHIKDSKISLSRLERYIMEKLRDVLEKIQSDAIEGSYIMWGIDILAMYNKGIEIAKKKGINETVRQRIFAADYTIGLCIGVMQAKLDMYCGTFGKELIDKIVFKDVMGMSALELNEIYLYTNKFDSYDAITDCAGVVRDMQLVEFGTIKAYVALIEDGLLLIETVAERIGMTVDEVNQIKENGMR